MNLFKGFESAHGQYRVNKKEADGKMSGRAVTVSDPATEINFKEHLNGGEYILGVIPLLNNNSCHFGVGVSILQPRRSQCIFFNLGSIKIFHQDGRLSYIVGGVVLQSPISSTEEYV